MKQMIDRQIDRQTDRQKDRQTDNRQIDLIFSISTVAINFHGIRPYPHRCNGLPLCFPTFFLAPIQPALNISAQMILICHSDYVISLLKVLPGVLTALRTNFKLTITSEVWKYAKTNHIRKTRLSELAIAWESVTVTCLLAETQTGGRVGKLLWKKGRLLCLTEGCGHREAIGRLTRREVRCAIG